VEGVSEFSRVSLFHGILTEKLLFKGICSSCACFTDHRDHPYICTSITSLEEVADVVTEAVFRFMERPCVINILRSKINKIQAEL